MIETFANERPGAVARRVNSILRRQDGAPQGLRLDYRDGVFRLLSDDVPREDGIAAIFASEASHDWVQLLAHAPQDIDFLLTLIADSCDRLGALESALAACIDAHATGRFEPMQIAIENAQNALEDEQKRKMGQATT